LRTGGIPDSLIIYPTPDMAGSFLPLGVYLYLVAPAEVKNVFYVEFFRCRGVSVVQ
jgi:hypothetical protein